MSKAPVTHEKLQAHGYTSGRFRHGQTHACHYVEWPWIAAAMGARKSWVIRRAMISTLVSSVDDTIVGTGIGQSNLPALTARTLIKVQLPPCLFSPIDALNSRSPEEVRRTYSGIKHLTSNVRVLMHLCFPGIRPCKNHGLLPGYGLRAACMPAHRETC